MNEEALQAAKGRCEAILRALGCEGIEWQSDHLERIERWYALAEYTTREMRNGLESAVNYVIARVYAPFGEGGRKMADAYWEVTAELPPYPMDPEASGGSHCLGAGMIGEVTP